MLGQQHGEFLAAHAADVGRVRHGGLEAAHHAQDHAVAHGVAEAVVHALEVVYVQHDQCQALLGEVAVHALDDGRAVEHAGQRVVRGAVLQLAGQLLQALVELGHLQLGAVAAAHQPARFAQQAVIGGQQRAQGLVAGPGAGLLAQLVGRAGRQQGPVLGIEKICRSGAGGGCCHGVHHAAFTGWPVKAMAAKSSRSSSPNSQMVSSSSS